MSKALQLTLALFKPDIIANPLATNEIRRLIIDKKFFFIQSKNIFLTRQRAEQFYVEHKGRFFYNRLVSFMSSGPAYAHILAREDAISEWRSLMGPTKVFKTIHEYPDSIRGRFGLSDTRNATHGSDSEKSARSEIEFFFPEFSFENWNKVDYRFDNTIYCDKEIIHNLN